VDLITAAKWISIWPPPKGFRPQTLLTSMLDATSYPADEIRELYHERWELELGYDEIKTEMLEREEAIRSRSPEGVRQELWGVFLAYNLVRLEMERIADEAGIEPRRVSFVTALRFIRDEWFWRRHRPRGSRCAARRPRRRGRACPSSGWWAPGRCCRSGPRRA
jgi:hypothetical protein